MLHQNSYLFRSAKTPSNFGKEITAGRRRTLYKVPIKYEFAHQSFTKLTDQVNSTYVSPLIHYFNIDSTFYKPEVLACADFLVQSCPKITDFLK